MLAVFDFDHTIVDTNSDIVARDMINPSNLIPNSKDFPNNWTGYMQKVFDILKNIEISADQVLNEVSLMEPVKGIPELMKAFHKNNVTIIIVSDSNSLFIDNWLKQNKLSETVLSIYTNPGKIEDGLIKIKPFTMQTMCELCTTNMCKGSIVKEHITLKINTNYNKIFYFGDGKNDLCPILKLTRNDIAFPRFGYTLDNLLKSHVVQAEIIPWCTGYNICEYLNSSNLILIDN